MPKTFTSKNQKIGEMGENIAVRYLEKNGYKIIGRNYTRKWGEIDIIAIRAKIIHFIEVKSKTADITKEKMHIDRYRPEDNMHPWKLLRLRRTVQTYLLERKINDNWIFDLIVVYLDDKSKSAKVELIENIVI